MGPRRGLESLATVTFRYLRAPSFAETNHGHPIAAGGNRGRFKTADVSLTCVSETAFSFRRLCGQIDRARPTSGVIDCHYNINLVARGYTVTDPISVGTIFLESAASRND